MTSQPMARWLVAKLIDDGVMTSDRVTKHAKPRRCPDCGLFTLVGLDDLLPRKVAVDVLPTTTAGEAFALLTGGKSFGMDGDELYVRTADRLEYRRADEHRVYIEHRCESPPLPINAKFMQQNPVDLNGPCPF